MSKRFYVKFLTNIDNGKVIFYTKSSHHDENRDEVKVRPLFWIVTISKDRGSTANIKGGRHPWKKAYLSSTQQKYMARMSSFRI